MEQYGNTHFNMERVLRENIVAHEYMRRNASQMNSWEEVVDEVYRAVEHVEPWMSGNVRGPSTAFCLLYRLFELKITEEQVAETIICQDSPYIRAVGFLYLRYVGHPESLMDWFQPHFGDKQKFWPSGEGFGKQVTVGEYVVDLLLCQNYFETIFTRIPKKVSDAIVKQLQQQALPSVPIGNAAQGGPDRRGGDDGRARPASVKASLSVALGQRAPNRAGVCEDAQQRISRRDDMATRPNRPPSDQNGRGAEPVHPVSRSEGRQFGGEPSRDFRAASERPRSRDWPRAGGEWRDDHASLSSSQHTRIAPDGHSRGDYRSRGRESDLPYRDRDFLARDQQHRRSPPQIAQRARMEGRALDNGRHRGSQHYRMRDEPSASTVFGRSAADVFRKDSTTSVRALPLDDLAPEEPAVKIGRRR